MRTAKVARLLGSSFHEKNEMIRNDQERGKQIKKRMCEEMNVLYGTVPKVMILQVIKVCLPNLTSTLLVDILLACLLSLASCFRSLLACATTSYTHRSSIISLKFVVVTQQQSTINPQSRSTRTQ